MRAAHAYFYARPGLGSRPLAAYVVRGDRVEGFSELRDFVTARFTDAHGQSTFGYLLEQDLEPAGP